MFSVLINWLQKKLEQFKNGEDHSLFWWSLFALEVWEDRKRDQFMEEMAEMEEDDEIDDEEICYYTEENGEVREKTKEELDREKEEFDELIGEVEED